MNATQNKAAIRDLRTLFGAGTLGVLSDGQLLDRFVARRDAPAFEALVLRHGPMVWGVCRRVLCNHHDAEDAFQATFLVLARKASSVVPREMVANWLYGVACRTALKSRTATAKRHAREKQVMEMPEPRAALPDQRDQLIPLLDQELSQLPEKYRTPIILCDLEGKTHGDAAFQLGWPIGTLSGRLSRARALLKKRLARRGLILTAGSLGSLVADRASACVSASVVSRTVKAASLIAAGQVVTAGLISARVLTLSEEVIKAMLLTKLRVLAVVLVMAAATGGVAFRTHGSETPFSSRKQAETPKVVLVAQQERQTAPRPRTARSAAEAFLSALSEGEVKEAARFCGPEEYDEATLWRLKKALQGSHPSVDSVDVVGTLALALSVKMKLKAEDGPDGNSETDARLMLVLCKKDEDWQIQNIQLGPARRIEEDRTTFRTPFLPR